jgi:hypothetical protein
MPAHGRLRSPVHPPVRLPVPEDEKAVIGLRQRESIGYGIANRTPASAVPAAERYGATLPAAAQARYKAAQFGTNALKTTVTLIARAKVRVPRAGCVVAARRRLAGDVRTWARLGYVPDQLDTRLSAQAVGDPRYKAALTSWRTCLRAEGFDYASPDMAQAALSAQYETTGGTAAFKRREIAVAVADGKCAGTVHLSTVLLTIRRSLVADMPNAELALLRTLTADRQTAVTRARAVLSRDTES